ncbi:MAG: LegC family aminotransferase [Pseudomonadales bacterium]|nr:LegC family aminotransferase [Pseudomonadales bacterium]
MSGINRQGLGQSIVAGLHQVLGPKMLKGKKSELSLHEPFFKGNEQRYVADCISSGWVSSVGRYVDDFESALGEVCGTGDAVATVNGTAALHICLLLAGVKPGDEVLMPTLTFVATANAVRYAGAEPHFCDSQRGGIGIDIPRLDEYLRDSCKIKNGVCINSRTQRAIRALIVMHTFGHIQQWELVSELAKKYNLIVIEDAAESLGSSYYRHHADNKFAAGSYGHLAAFSFNGNKIVTAGGGGAIVTTDPNLASHAKHLTTTAKSTKGKALYHDAVGYNYRMPNINAALALAQLEQLDNFVGLKRNLASRYEKALSRVEGCEFLKEPEGCVSNYWLNSIRLPNITEIERDELLESLAAEGFQCRPVWTPMHHLPMYQNSPRMALSLAEKLQNELINIPSSAFLGR